MQSLNPKENLPLPDAHYLRAAEGWIELGDHISASDELEKISPEWQEHPAVLNLRWSIYAQARQWSAAYEIALQLVTIAPEDPSSWIHRSYVLHEMKRTQEAWDKLLPVWERFPEEPVIAYNLGCYACQMGKLDVAWEWLQQAALAGDREKILQMASDDPDLEPLWSRLHEL